MRRKSLVALFLLMLSLSISVVFFGWAQNQNQTISANYRIASYVIGSGGVMGSSSSSHYHSATAGEEIAGVSFSENNILLSGYWQTEDFLPTAIADNNEAASPNLFKLHQNYPNPFNPQTTIEYDLPVEAIVCMDIFNLTGQKIRTLLNAALQGAGFRQVIWNGCDDQGKLVGSGVYLFRLIVLKSSTANQAHEILYQQSQKMLFVK